MFLKTRPVSHIFCSVCGTFRENKTPFCLRWPVETFFLCPLFIIYVHTSIVIGCQGNPAYKTLPAHTYTGRESIFPPLSPRECVRTHALMQHTHAHTHKPPTKMYTSHSLPTSSSHDYTSQIQGHRISPPLNGSYFQFFFLSHFLISLMSDQGHLILSNPSRIRAESDTACTGCCKVVRFGATAGSRCYREGINERNIIIITEMSALQQPIT